MKLPVEQFIKQINHKKVYYFFSDQLVNTVDCHYFVCVGIDTDNLIILNCFTTKIQRRIQYIESREIDYSTLVFAKPTPENGLTDDCVVDCNKLFFHTTEEFKTLYESDKIQYKGELEDNYYEQICTGINNSKLIEEEIKLKIKKIE